jgi:hypothetical protein
MQMSTGRLGRSVDVQSAQPCTRRGSRAAKVARRALANFQQPRIVSQRRVRLLVGEARLVPHTCCVAALELTLITNRVQGLVVGSKVYMQAAAYVYP